MSSGTQQQSLDFKVRKLLLNGFLFEFAIRDSSIDRHKQRGITKESKRHSARSRSLASAGEDQLCLC